MLKQDNVPPGVVIFRKRILSYSETFIADQGKNLNRYNPVYCGYQVDRSGFDLIGDADSILIDQFSRLPLLAKLRLRHNLGANKFWIDEIKQHAPKLIHAHFLNDGIDAIKLGKILDVPVIATVHGHDITKHTNTQNRTHKQFFDGVERVIAVSDFIGEHALDKGCPPEKLIKHSIGIDLERFHQPKQETEQPSILFVGRLVEKKGCTYLLQAMEKISAKFPELLLTIVGEGGLKPALAEQANASGLNVEFVGTESASKIRDRLASCWCFVAPSITAENGDAEGLGMVFLEAQALHTPVVSFRSGGVVEAVEEESTALLCDEKDVESLAENIATLLNDSTLRRQMGDRGRNRVEKYFDIRKQCVKLEKIYDDVSKGSDKCLPQ